MFLIDINDRSNIATGGIAGQCGTCCCAPLKLIAGEIQLITMNYAPWTIPIMSNGGPGLVPTPDFSTVADSKSCSFEPINGFAPPSTTNTLFNSPNTVALNTALVLNLLGQTLPLTNSFIWELVPLAGPTGGVVTITGPGNWTYTPFTGFNGYDQFWVKITDAQGRVIYRPINLRVGNVANSLPPFGWGFEAREGVLIDLPSVQVDQRRQTVSFPVMLTLTEGCDTIDACKNFRISVKATARDCERVFTRIDCIDVSCGKC